MKPKIRPTDSKYSKIIRSERPICEACMRRSSSQIHHYYGRGHENTRFDGENIVSVCFTCHRKFHEDNDFARQFMIKKLGEKKFDALTLRKNLYKKRDDHMDALWLKTILT